MQYVFSIILLAVGVASIHHRVGVDFDGVMSQDGASLSKAEVERSATESSDDLVVDQQTSIAGSLLKIGAPLAGDKWERCLAKDQTLTKLECTIAIVGAIRLMTKDQCWDLFVAKDQNLTGDRGAYTSALQFRGKTQYTRLSRWVHPDKLQWLQGNPQAGTLAKDAADALHDLNEANDCFPPQRVGNKTNLCDCFTEKAAIKRADVHVAAKIRANNEREKARIAKEHAEELEKEKQTAAGKFCCCRKETSDACSKLESKWFGTRRFFKPIGGGQCCKLVKPKSDATVEQPCDGRTNSKDWVLDGCNDPVEVSDVAAEPAGAEGAEVKEVAID